MHCRQAPSGSSSGWSQNRGTWIPSISAARMISVFFGTVSSMPSIVQLTVSVTGQLLPLRGLPPPERTGSGGSGPRNGSCREEGRRRGVERAAALLPVGDVLVLEVLHR